MNNTEKADKIDFANIKTGDTSFFEKEIREADVAAFASVSGDYNPLHMDESYALNTEFHGRIVHGLFLGALVSKLVGMKLPGEKALLLKETLEFKKPARIGDKLLVKGTVVSKSEVSRIVELEVKIYKDAGILVTGSVYVKVMK